MACFHDGAFLGLHAFVVRSSATLGRNPVDNLVGIGDVTGLAVHAVGGVDFQTSHAFFLDHLVDRRRAEILAGISVLGDASAHADVGIEHVQMARLIFLMARTGIVDVGEAIESELAVALKARRGGSGRGDGAAGTWG